MKLSGLVALAPGLQGFFDPAPQPSGHVALSNSAASGSAASSQSGTVDCIAQVGRGGFGDNSNFKLTAYSAKLSPNNDTGIPLALGYAGAAGGAQFKVLATWETAQSNDWPTFSLSGGHLAAHGPGVADADSGRPMSNGEILFFTPPQPGWVHDTSYCGRGSLTGGHSELVLNTYDNLFSLCPESSKPGAQNVVRFNATANNGGFYDYSKCEPVKILMI